MSDPKKRKAYDHGGMDEVFTDFGDIFAHFNSHSFFNDIFANDPFFNDFGGFTGFNNMNNMNMNNNVNNNNTNNMGAFGGGFGNDFGGGFGSIFSSAFGGGGGDDGFTSFTSTSSFGGFGGGGNGANVMSQSISTSYVNGKKITTKKIQQNGQTIVEKYENNELIMKSINGQQQQLDSIEYNNDNNDNNDNNNNNNKRRKGSKSKGYK